MNNEFLKMQKLAGLITESQYKEKLNEVSQSEDIDNETIMNKVKAIKPLFSGLNYPDSVIVNFVQTHFNDIVGFSDEEIMDEFKEFITINFEANINEGNKEYFKPLIRKNKSNPNFLYVDILYPVGTGFTTALGSKTMSGQDREEGAAKALAMGNAIAKKLQAKYDLEDIDVSDLENGKVEVFAVSDDFIKIDSPSLDEAKISHIVGGIPYKRKGMILEAKKSEIDKKLAEIDKEGKITTLEAKIAAIDEVIEAKNSRINMVQEDENLSELIDKKRVKEMQNEIKLLEKSKKLYKKQLDKANGKKEDKKEIVDEQSTESYQSPSTSIDYTI